MPLDCMNAIAIHYLIAKFVYYIKTFKFSNYHEELRYKDHMTCCNVFSIDPSIIIKMSTKSNISMAPDCMNPIAIRSFYLIAKFVYYSKTFKFCNYHEELRAI